MTRKFSEKAVRSALAAMDLEHLEVFKPDDSPSPSQWRPCDFMVWWSDSNADPVTLVVHSAWLEVKESRAVSQFTLSLLRPSQVAAMRRAVGMGLPYFLVVYWPKRTAGMARWTITTAAKVLERYDAVPRASSARFIDLSTGGGIEASPAQLGYMLRMALLGEL